MDGKTVWDTDLEPEEKLLWFGRPAGVFGWPGGVKVLVIFFALGGAFSGYHALMAYQGGHAYWLQYFTIALAALVAISGSIWMARHEHYDTRYALTNRRAFIAIERPFLGRKVTPYPIHLQTPITYDGADPGDVLFATKRHRNQHNCTHIVGYGFRNIENSAQVYALLQHVRRSEI